MKLYKYLFYQIYKFLKFTNVDFPYWLDIKTVFVLYWIEIMLGLLINYKVSKYVNWIFLSEKYLLCLIGILPFIINYYIFGYQDKHKKIINYFDKIDKKEKKKLNIQLLVLVLFLIGFVAFLFSV